MFTLVLQLLAKCGLIKGERIGVDASTIEANAALRAIVRRATGEGYREMLGRMAKESGIERALFSYGGRGDQAPVVLCASTMGTPAGSWFSLRPA